MYLSLQQVTGIVDHKRVQLYCIANASGHLNIPETSSSTVPEFLVEDASSWCGVHHKRCLFGAGKVPFEMQ